MRRTLICAALTLAVAACSGGDSSATTTPASSSPSSTPTEPAGAEQGTSDSTDGAAPVEQQTGLADPTGSPTAGDTETAPMEVESSALPRDVANALSTNGGELAATDDWAQRFGTNNLPTLAGTAVHLVEGTIQITSDAGMWTRLDELQWIFVTPAVRDDLLDQLAAETGIADWDVAETSSTVDSAECVVRDYSSPAATDEWTLQGCQFPTFDNLLSIGVSHSATTTDLGELPFIDPSVAGVVADADATFDQLLVTFGAPTPGSTTTLTIALDATVPSGTDTATVLAAGALQSWSRSDGEAGAAVFTGGPGSYWTTNGTDLRFSNEGRLAP
jgi:hypothetical protein